MQSLIDTPRYAVATVAIYAILATNTQIWIYKELNKRRVKTSTLLTWFSVLIGCYLLVTGLNLFTYYIDQPVLITGSAAELLASQELHSGLKSKWVLSAYAPIIIDLFALVVSYKVPKRDKFLTIIFAFLVAFDVAMLAVYLAI